MRPARYACLHMSVNSADVYHLLVARALHERIPETSSPFLELDAQKFLEDLNGLVVEYLRTFRGGDPGEHAKLDMTSFVKLVNYSELSGFVSFEEAAMKIELQNVRAKLTEILVDSAIRHGKVLVTELDELADMYKHAALAPRIVSFSDPEPAIGRTEDKVVVKSEVNVPEPPAVPLTEQAPPEPISVPQEAKKELEAKPETESVKDPKTETEQLEASPSTEKEVQISTEPEALVEEPMVEESKEEKSQEPERAEQTVSPKPVEPEPEAEALEATEEAAGESQEEAQKEAAKETTPVGETGPAEEPVSPEKPAEDAVEPPLEEASKELEEDKTISESSKESSPPEAQKIEPKEEALEKETVTDTVRRSARKRSTSPLVNTQKHKRFQSIAINLIKTIEEHRFSSPFLVPVAAEDYEEVVYHPKDLKSILKAVKQKDTPAYETVKQLERDIMLMFANCVMYNKSTTHLVAMAEEMKNDVRNTFKMFEDAELGLK